MPQMPQVTQITPRRICSLALTWSHGTSTGDLASGSTAVAVIPCPEPGFPICSRDCGHAWRRVQPCRAGAFVLIHGGPGCRDWKGNIQPVQEIPCRKGRSRTEKFALPRDVCPICPGFAAWPRPATPLRRAAKRSARLERTLGARATCTSRRAERTAQGHAPQRWLDLPPVTVKASRERNSRNRSHGL